MRLTKGNNAFIVCTHIDKHLSLIHILFTHIGIRKIEKMDL